MPRLTKRRGRKSSYMRKLSSAEWQSVARRARMRDGHRCRLCGSNINLEVHHTTYYVNGHSIVGYEEKYLDKLITLCSVCHARHHKKR